MRSGVGSALGRFVKGFTSVVFIPHRSDLLLDRSPSFICVSMCRLSFALSSFVSVCLPPSRDFHRVSLRYPVRNPVNIFGPKKITVSSRCFGDSLNKTQLVPGIASVRLNETR
jgi:hypothetical protein